MKEHLEERERMLNRIKQEQESNSKKAAEQAEKAELAKLENLLTPAFNKYRFSGKLGDAEAEANLDSAIFARAKEALSEIPDEIELTSKENNTFQKYVQAETKKKETKEIKNKQAEAAKKVAVATGSTPAEASNEVKAKELLKQGKGKEALMAFLGR